jgi:hypothetical protein
MWLFVILGLAFLVLALAGGLQVVPAPIGLLGLGGFFFSLVCTIVLGYQSRQVALEEKSKSGATTMLVMMAGMLKEEDDETLQRIVDKGGPAGDAASMILQKRRAP